jgi:glutathione S-transferase
MLQLYLDPCTVNCRKVLAGLDMLGAQYEINHVDYFTGGHKKPEFLAINPNGAVPAAKDGDFELSESNAILQYAADLSGSDKHYPKDLKRRADVNRGFCGRFHLVPELLCLSRRICGQATLKGGAGRKPSLPRRPNWHRLADILDKRLAKSKWLVGDTPTIADIAVAAPMHVHKMQRLPLDDHPNLKRWMADIEQLPCWQKTQGAVDRALQAK